jgi:CRP-like cAMP-binding protein
MALVRGVLDTDQINVIPEIRPIAESVLRAFTMQSVEPAISEAAEKLSLFQGLSSEQTQLLAGLCRLERFQEGDQLFVQGAESEEMFLILEGRVSINMDAPPRRIGYIEPGESVGERALLTSELHTAAATAKSSALAAVLTRNDLTNLIRQRPDIGLVLYKNLAIGLGQKLLRTDS